MSTSKGPLSVVTGVGKELSQTAKKSSKYPLRDHCNCDHHHLDHHRHCFPPSILVTVVIINWNFRGPRTHSMPNWIRVIMMMMMIRMIKRVMMIMMFKMVMINMMTLIMKTLPTLHAQLDISDHLHYHCDQKQQHRDCDDLFYEDIGLDDYHSLRLRG